MGLLGRLGAKQGKARCGGSRRLTVSDVPSVAGARPCRRAGASKGAYLRRRVVCVAYDFKQQVNGDGADRATRKGAAGAQEGVPRKEPHKTKFNVIEGNSRWDTGVPSLMGGHLMASGSVAPLSKSKTVLDGPDDPTGQFAHPFHYRGEDLDGEHSKVAVYPSKAALGKGLVESFAAQAKASIEKKGSFTVALAGGSVLTMLEGLAPADLDWSKVHVFFVDERLAPLDSEDSNAGAATRGFLGALPVPEGQVHVIDASLSVDQAARAYEGRMLNVSADVLPREGTAPVLDLVVLGMGPDGHVASLFPNRTEAADDPSHSWVLAVRNSPKPPSERISMSMNVINSAREVMVVAAGQGKAEVVQRVLEVQSLPGALPAQLVKPYTGVLSWMLDKEAASALSPSEWGNAKAFPRSAFPKKSKKPKKET